MNISEFTSLLDNKKAITIAQTNAIEDILENYPYFQAARMIHLKGLKNQHSFKYNSALKTTAAYTTNRTVLFDFITADTLDNSKALEKQQEIIDTNEVVDLEIVDKSENNKSNTLIVEEAIVKKVEEKLNIGKPLVFDLSEMHSFSEWLQLTDVKPIEREESSEVETPKKQPAKNKEKFDIIEQFITSKPKLEVSKTIENIDVSFESVIEDGTLMTETLARVYLEQKKYDKAIQAFKILSLKYPEKSSFFADRIKAIKFLQKNNS
ncbi:tetratricopeptide repeat protein [Aureibaculum conchae]|uniref:tetratricopeptide repeat protein n=1 Tax=Aureibaculum sp. 2308TA14-22 TaxID=3108392 RepID=UPI0033909706